MSITCDELPPASVEEGGDWYGDVPVAPALECAPAWQQNSQGACNTLARNIKTNAQYAADPEATPLWVNWKDNTKWFTANAWNEITTYPYAIPQAEGISADQWGIDETGGWLQRRSFTYWIASPSSATDWSVWGGTTGSWKFKSSAGTSTDAINVICAINLWDQPQGYGLIDEDFNAYCYSGTSDGVFDKIVTYPKLSRCLVTLGATVATRDQVDVEKNLSSLYGRVITNITMLDDDDDDDLTEAMQTLDIQDVDKVPTLPLDILETI
ncbi:uncharacterized protein N7483_008918 [Penicillium malachiteum]|uniref:uncharacterized protein n=1 Tax=Penicillium malachiteum TaxID=1324776 RepID=UPI002546DD35|nr:uncharacterized protein N7483_008918 [Penicillium malachiteum]KAJ5720984.1 hypothetical protein N7483_008918 [Penicillium malachiteum]